MKYPLNLNKIFNFAPESLVPLRGNSLVCPHILCQKYQLKQGCIHNVAIHNVAIHNTAIHNVAGNILDKKNKKNGRPCDLCC